MAKGYQITEEQRSEIEAARRKNRNKNVERRLRVLAMRAEGKSLKDIAKATEYHYAYVSTIISQYAKDGLGAIVENHYHGNRRNMSFEEEATILAPFIFVLLFLFHDSYILQQRVSSGYPCSLFFHLLVRVLCNSPLP